jgi:hypothetical protein
MKKTVENLFALLAAAVLLALGSGTAAAGGRVDTSPARFGAAVFTNSEEITNPWWTLTDNNNYLYYAEGPDECEWNLMEVQGSYEHNFDTPYTGVQARIILDRAWVDEDCESAPTEAGFAAFMESVPQAAESTYDWYAQDEDGNVWYLGEDTYNGEDKHGSFVAGCNGAEAGIVVLGDPKNGNFYQQEYDAGNAEDWGKVLNFMLVDDDVCMRTKEWTPLEPGHVEQKFYCSDGDYGELALVRELKGKTVIVELVAKNADPPVQAVTGLIASEPTCL